MITYDQIHFLLDFEVISENYDKILAIQEYLPSLIRSILRNFGYSHTTHKKEVKFYSIKRKKLYSKCYNKNMMDLFYLTEILCFILRYPQFRIIIKDENYLEELINKCETKYNINMVDYINSYDDLEKLLKDLEE